MSLSMKKGLKQEPTGTMYDEQERQKMLRLNREMQEPKEPRLEWIYTGDRNKSEDYLLGKKYDANAPTESIAAATDESITTSTVDLANKIREDPLFLIKKREIEETKRLLDNPVRLKQIKELLEQQESASSSHKKRKRHSRSRSRSPDRHRRQHSHHHHHHRRRSPSPPARRRRSPPPPKRRERTPPRPAKPSKEERERRIREMLVDGAVRTEQRQENVRKYKERDDKEDQLNELIRQRAKKKTDLSSSDDEDEGFSRPMMKQVVDDPSLKRRDLKHHYHKRH